MNAFASFIEPSYGPSILIYREWSRNLYLIHEYKSMNIKLSLPYLAVNPIETTKAGDNETYLIKATSVADDNTTVTCSQTLNFFYIENSDPSIFKTGLQGRQ